MDGKNKRKYLIALVVVFLVAIVVASYAVFSYFKSSDGENVLRTGTLILSLDDKALNLIDTVPLSDQEAVKAPAYNFSIKNTGTETAKYQIYILDDEDKYQNDNCSEKKLPWSHIRYSIQKEGENNIIESLEGKHNIYTTTLKSGMTDNYKLRLWIDERATNEIAGLHFHAKLQVKAILEDKTDFDTGA